MIVCKLLTSSLLLAFVDSVIVATLREFLRGLECP